MDRWIDGWIDMYSIQHYMYNYIHMHIYIIDVYTGTHALAFFQCWRRASGLMQDASAPGVVTISQWQAAL